MIGTTDDDLLDEQAAEIARLNTLRIAEKRENARLRAAVERMAIGVNHIATYRTDAWPDYGSACDAALEKLGAGREYDMWCCWNAAMCARDALDQSAQSPEGIAQSKVRDGEWPP